MIEIIVWITTLLLAGIAQVRCNEYGAISSGITYITVAVAALLALYFKYDTDTFIELTTFLKEWWILETFIFLNVVTGYSFYERSRRRKPT